MSKINVLSANANGSLDESKEAILAAVKEVESYAFSKLKNEGLNLEIIQGI